MNIIILNLAFNLQNMRLFVLSLSVLLSLNLFAQKGDPYLCVWNDGKDSGSEISSEKFLCSKKGKVCYLISNNKDNVLLDLRVEDVMVQNRILKEGMTIWISMDGKLTKKMGVRFPIGSQRSSGRGRNGMELMQTNPDGSMVTPLSLANSIELIGFTSESERRLPSENADSFNGFVKYDNNGILQYRLLMPISKIPIRNSKDSNGPMPFIIGVEYGESAPASNDLRGSAPPPPGGGGSGGRGGPGGGRGGGMPGGSGQARSLPNTAQVSKPPVIIWIRNIKLATGK